MDALRTDLYQLTMAAGYFHRGMTGRQATCEMFVRRLPAHRRYLVAMGLERALAYLEGLRFDEEEIAFLATIPNLRDAMTPAFCAYLRDLRFTGDAWAMPEGTVLFAGEPLVRITAPLVEAQLVETFLLSAVNHATMVASKAARMVLAAGDATCVDCHLPAAGLAKWWAKGMNGWNHSKAFTLQDRQALLDLIRLTLEELIPRYSALAARGQIELSSTPYAHPLAPLLLDFHSAREAQPELPLPQSPCYPGGRDRIDAHIGAAFSSHQHRFGTPPAGIWPERSTCISTPRRAPPLPTRSRRKARARISPCSSTRCST